MKSSGRELSVKNSLEVDSLDAYNAFAEENRHRGKPED